MKVALCLSGQLRTFKSCFPAIKASILDPYTPDVYVCTDPNPKYSGSIGDGVSDGTFEEMKELYKPECVVSVDNTWFDSPSTPKIDNNKLLNKKIDSCNLDRFLGDLLKRYHVGFWCKTWANQYNIKYDVVIRARFDLEINGVLPIIQREGITIPVGQDWLDGINDQLAWGDPESMFWYLDMIKHIEEYSDLGIATHPETMLKHHLNVKGIAIDRVPVNYIIKRV